MRCFGKWTNCCTEENPCKAGDGDCDNDDQCDGDLVCGTNNCVRNNPNFYYYDFGSDSDCCVESGSGSGCKHHGMVDYQRSS